jgi:hypothetical protein
MYRGNVGNPLLPPHYFEWNRLSSHRGQCDYPSYPSLLPAASVPSALIVARFNNIVNPNTGNGSLMFSADNVVSDYGGRAYKVFGYDTTESSCFNSIISLNPVEGYYTSYNVQNILCSSGESGNEGATISCSVYTEYDTFAITLRDPDMILYIATPDYIAGTGLIAVGFTKSYFNCEGQ